MTWSFADLVTTYAVVDEEVPSTDGIIFGNLHTGGQVVPTTMAYLMVER